MPAELQQCIHKEVQATRRRSDWPAGQTLHALGVSRSSYYRWRRKQAWAQPVSKPPRPVQVYEALAEEREAVLAYARAHPQLRHREMAWRMVDEDVACLSPSTVYRILREAQLVSAPRRRAKRSRTEAEKARRADERWATDLLHLQVGEGTYYLIAFEDEYARYVVHHQLLSSMDGQTVSVEAQAAVETLGPKDWDTPEPEIRSDNGSGYISKEFRGVLREHGLTHRPIQPHCPEENGIMERTYRTFREALEGEELTDLVQAREVVDRIVRWYNEERLHSALGFLRPIDYYRGRPEALQAIRRRKLAEARHARKEANLQIQQRTLPLHQEEPVA